MYQDADTKPTMSSQHRAGRAGSGSQPSSQPGSERRCESGSAQRRAALSIAVALVMAGGAAQATVTLNFGDSDLGSALTAGTNVSYWTDYSQSCQNVVGGSTCSVGSTPAANPVSMLFSWGTGAVTDRDFNSLMTATYTGAGATLTSLTLTSEQSGLGPSGGPNATFRGPYATPTGTGSMVAYEQASSGGTNRALFQHNASEQRVNISVGGTQVLSNQLVLGGLGLTDGQQSRYTDPAPPNSPDPDGENTIVQYGFSTQFDFAGPIDLVNGDVIELRFFESLWNNNNVGDVAGQAFPDAYYGPMQVTINGMAADTSELAVTPSLPDPLDPLSLDLGNLRAGDSSTATGSLTARNIGSGVIDGTFNAPTGDTARIGFTDPSGADFSLAADDTDPRNYSFDASTVALGLSDTSGQSFSLTQEVVSNADVSPDATRTVTGSAVGPVLGVSLDATDPLDPAQNFAYDAVIDLGDIAVDGGALTRELVLANLFGTDLSDLTTLSIDNIGLIGNDVALFSIVGGGSLSSLEAQEDSTLMIAFDPEALGVFSTTLFFVTDMNNPFGDFGTCSAGAGSDISNGCVAFTLTGTGTDAGAAPAPGSLLLLMAGALGYPLFGHRRSRR